MNSLFQSLFYWKYHFNKFFTKLLSSTMRVSILILLEVPLQQGRKMFENIQEISFNPYFTGSTTSTRRYRQGFYCRKMFQSLFYWKYHFNGVEPESEVEHDGVSILILLEVPLQQRRLSL